MVTNDATPTNDHGGAFEPWMIANFAAGAVFSAFVALLIPPFVTETTGNAADAGVVMAVISLAAVLGPVLGGFADTYRAHRLVLNLGVLGMALAFAAYALSAENQALYALDAILMGVAIAAVNAVAPVFVLAAGLPQALQAKRLTTLNLLSPIGQVVGGAVIGAATGAGWSYSQRFWLAAGFTALCFVVTWLTTARPATRIQVVAPGAESEAVDAARKQGLGQVLASTLGVYLLIVMLSSAANNGINNQIANILPNVYGLSPAATSGLISLAGLLNIGLFVVAGAFMAKRGPVAVYSFGNIVRLIGALGMALVGMLANAPALLAAGFIQVLYQSNPFVRLTQPAVAIRFATIAAGQATGWVIGAVALGSFVGSMLGGFLADSVGFNAINWMGVIGMGAAVALQIFGLGPAERRKKAQEQAVDAPPTAPAV